MIKSDLIRRVAAENPHLYEADVERVVGAILGRVSDALAAGDRVELRGFGAFTVTERGARTGRTPKTGEAVGVEAKRVSVFRVGKAMQRRLNPSGAVTSGELDAAVSGLVKGGSLSHYRFGRPGGVGPPRS